MTDHKFTDDDVIKALECCACGDGCEACPRSKQCDGVEHLQNAVDLINRQRAEIDTLRNDTIPKLENALERANYYGLKADEEVEHLKVELASLNRKYELAVAEREANARALVELGEKIKMEFYYEFDEIIPSIMADKISKIIGGE